MKESRLALKFSLSTAVVSGESIKNLKTVWNWCILCDLIFEGAVLEAPVVYHDKSGVSYTIEIIFA